jgi:hypothetical protein
MLNLAPEPFMIFNGRHQIGDGYEGADYDPSLFAKWGQPIRRLDLCSDVYALPPNYYDVVMHNHVLEHVPCDVSRVLDGVNRTIKLGGYHLFSVPIRPNSDTVEDLDPTLTSEERRRRFGQEDHMRYFGDRDFERFLERANMKSGMINLRTLVSQEEIATAGIPLGVLDTINAHRVFVWRKS